MDKHSKRSSSLLHYPVLVVFSLFFIGLFALDLITPDRAYSEMENTTLSQRPALTQLSAKGLNSYFTAYTKYVKDQVFGRDNWISLQSVVETTLLQKEQSGGILLGKEHMMFPRTFGLLDSENRTLPKNTAAVEALCQRYPGKVDVLLAPAASVIYPEKVPANAPLLDEDAYLDQLSAAVQAAGGRFVDVRQTLAEHKDEYIYYRTDHHWTSLGAYYAYCAAAKTLGYSAYTLDQFNIETASSSFRGTLYSKTLDNGVTPDSIDYFHLASGGPKVKMTVFDGTKETVYDSLYVRSYLDVKDKYSSFTGSNSPIVTIETDVDNGKTLLLIKDSYAHSLVPFLANHYSKITMVDMRYINVDLGRLIDLSEYQQAMFMYNAVTFSSDLTIKRISLTK